MRMTGKIGLALVLIGVGAVSLSGCGSSCHDNVSVTWTLVDASNIVRHCDDVGAQTVVVNMGSMSATFNCIDYQGQTPALPAGTYSTSVQLLDGSGKVLSETTPQDVIVSGCGTIRLPQVAFGVCAQDVALTWTVVDNATNQPLTCQTVGAGTVRLNLGSNVFNFDCKAGAGLTTMVPEGPYATSVDLFDLNGAPLSQTSTMNVTVPHCGGVTLPNIEFGVQ